MRGPGGARTSPTELVGPAGGPKGGSKSDSFLMSRTPPKGTSRRDPLISPGTQGRLNGTPKCGKVEDSCVVWTSKTGRPETLCRTPGIGWLFRGASGRHPRGSKCMHFGSHFWGGPVGARKCPGCAQGKKRSPEPPPNRSRARVPEPDPKLQNT